jgi:molecular chaperone DnaK
MNGEAHLGGELFDIVLVDFILTEFKKEPGIDRTAIQRIPEAAKKAKIELHETERLTFPSSLLTLKRPNSKLTRSRFESRYSIPLISAQHQRTRRQSLILGILSS